MKKVLFFICFVVFQQYVMSQDANSYETATKTFQTEFNAQNTDAIFNLYNAEMQSEMTKEGVTKFVKGCYSQFGNLKKLTFIETAEGINSYTAEFDNINLIMELLLDANGKIAAIQFQEP